MEDIKRLLEDVLTAEVLVLAKTMKAEKAAKGTHSTSDFIPEAIKLVQQKRDEVLRGIR